MALGRIANGCGHRLEADARAHATYCSPACRQAAYRRRLDPNLVPRGRGARRAGQPARALRALPGGAIDAQAPARDDRPSLTLVEAVSPDRPMIPAHAHSGRLCAVCSTHRLEQIRPAPRARRSAEVIGEQIRAAGGDIGPALDAGLSYRHALRIRAGWRGAGRMAPPVPYRSRGYADGYKAGRSPEAIASMTGRPQARPSHGADVLARVRTATARAAELAQLAARTLELVESPA